MKNEPQKKLYLLSDLADRYKLTTSALRIAAYDGVLPAPRAAGKRVLVWEADQLPAIDAAMERRRQRRKDGVVLDASLPGETVETFDIEPKSDADAWRERLGRIVGEMPAEDQPHFRLVRKSLDDVPATMALSHEQAGDLLKVDLRSSMATIHWPRDAKFAPLAVAIASALAASAKVADAA